jgi:hypothetical protein
MATLEYLLPVNCRKNIPHLHAVPTANSATLHHHRKHASVSLTSTSPSSPRNVFSKTRNLQTHVVLDDNLQLVTIAAANNRQPTAAPATITCSTLHRIRAAPMNIARHLVDA